jgi:SAM-dependent methyltransferase
MVEMAGGEIQGPALEIGCAAGGVTLELARLTGGPALGVDLFYPLVRLFQSMLATGHARVPLRRSGTVYDETEILLSEAQRECAGRVDGWCADGAMLPFADASAGVVVAINVLDVTASPLELLREMRRVLRPGGVLMVCTPYDCARRGRPFACARDAADSWRESRVARVDEAGRVKARCAMERARA